MPRNFTVPNSPFARPASSKSASRSISGRSLRWKHYEPALGELFADLPQGIIDRHGRPVPSGRRAPDPLDLAPATDCVVRHPGTRPFRARRKNRAARTAMMTEAVHTRPAARSVARNARPSSAADRYRRFWSGCIAFSQIPVAVSAERPEGYTERKRGFSVSISLDASRGGSPGLDSAGLAVSTCLRTVYSPNTSVAGPTGSSWSVTCE